MKTISVTDRVETVLASLLKPRRVKFIQVLEDDTWVLWLENPITLEAAEAAMVARVTEFHTCTLGQIPGHEPWGDNLRLTRVPPPASLTFYDYEGE